MGRGARFLAEDPLLRRQVPIKLPPDEYRADPGRRHRLLQEARAASSLNHPNIVTIHDPGESEAGLFVAMEHIQGETPQPWARRRHDPLESLALMRQATRAPDAAHRAGLVHRDLKPQNLMVRPDGTLKVLDLGLARTVAPAGADASLTMPGMLIGTLPYMAPEQELGQPATPARDLFSPGVILYELLAGRRARATSSTTWPHSKSACARSLRPGARGRAGPAAWRFCPSRTSAGIRILPTWRWGSRTR